MPHRPYRIDGLRQGRAALRLGGAGLVLLAGLLVGCGGEPAVRVEDGFVDLSAARLDGVVSLSGTWRARAGADSIAFAAFLYDDAHWQPVPVPGTFRRQGFPREGLVWYRLHLRLPPDVPPLKGFVRYANTAYTLYAAVPGAPPVLLAEGGHPALDPAAHVPDRRLITFTLPAATEMVLAWKVASHDVRDGGPFMPLRLGPAGHVDRTVAWHTALTFATFGFYLMLTLLFLFHWALRRRDVQALSVGLIALMLALHQVATSGVMETLWPGAGSFALHYRLEAATYLALNGLLALVLVSFFPGEFAPLRVGRFRLGAGGGLPMTAAGGIAPKVFTGAVLVAVGASALFTVAALAAPPGWTSHLLAVNRWLALGLMGPAVGIVGRALWHRRPLARTFALVFALVLFGGVHDILLGMGVLRGEPYLMPLTFLGFMLLQAYVVVYGNVAARRQARWLEEAIEQRSRRLRAAGIAIQASKLAEGQFLAAVSHELRTPLSAILGYTQMLEGELTDRLEPHHREFLQTIRVSAERLLVLINDLLDLSQIEAGKMELNPERFALRPLVEEVVRQVYPLAAQKQLALEARFEAEDPTVYADAMRLRQVLLNLLSNAVKFTDEGRVVVAVSAATLGEQPAVEIRVQDTGAGISPTFMPRIFDRFTQEERLYGKHQGSGLGLAIARELVVRMGGRISVESELHRGSTFTVVLPATGPEEAGRESRRPPAQSTPGSPVT